MTDQPFTPSMPVPQTRGTTPVILSPEAIHGPLKIGPSGAQVEQARQAAVTKLYDSAMGRVLDNEAACFNDLADRNDRAAAYIARRKTLHWSYGLAFCLAALLVIYGIASYQRIERYSAGAPPSVPAAEATGTLAERITALESEIKELREQVARTEGNVEARIDAYAMVEAAEIISEQKEP